jgi:hypothetical protein
LLFAFFVATCFVANLTSSLTRLDSLTRHQSNHQRVLRNFLREKKVSPGLSARIQHNAKLALQVQQKNILEAEVELLGLISEPLRIEVHSEMYIQTLVKHPFFDVLNRNQAQVFRKLCHRAVSSMAIAQNQTIFSRGEQPTVPSMLFLTQGTMSYSINGVTWEHVERDTWIAEHVLWTSWIFHGTLVAKTECQVTMVHAERFQELMLEQPLDVAEGVDARDYAKEFMKKLRDTEEEERTDIGCLTNCLELVDLVSM